MNTPSNSGSFHTPRCSKNPLRRSLRGFTLVEMLVSLVITSILMSAAIPSMTAAVDSIRLSSASSMFISALHLARSEAIKRNGRVVVCKSADGVSCAVSGGWEQGWIVFHDANGNGLREGSETIVLHEHALSAGLKLAGNLNVARYVSYTALGTAKLVDGAFQAGTLTLCKHAADGGNAHQIVLSATGRPRLQKTTTAACA
ncbi:MAG: GspH/FimT family pseudopilin [Ramlibacter sp.]